MRLVACAALAVLAAIMGNPRAALSGGAASAWEAPAFDRAEGNRRWSFPEDHGQHPAFRLEWWYYTGLLRTASGREYGFQVTFFRQGIAHRPAEAASPWRVQSLYLAHVALSDIQKSILHQAARLERDSLGLSGASADRLQVWLRDWRLDPLPDDPHGARVTVGDGRFTLRLDLRAEKPPVLHGDHGLDQKGPAAGQASWYYSLPRLSGNGTLRLEDQVEIVTATAWMDHEFGTNQLGEDQAGWDWFAIRLSDGHDLMLYRLRRKDGSAAAESHGTWIDPKGRATTVRLSPVTTLRPVRQWTSPTTGGRYPVAWELRLPEQNLSLTVTPRFDAQELQPGLGLPFGYWEGAIAVTGEHGGKPVTGEGYLELTGYAGALTDSFR